jgi:hypothetical protein
LGEYCLGDFRDDTGGDESLEVKEAVLTAKQYAAELFADEHIVNLGLEEVVFDEGTWRVTVGFSRPWDKPTGPAGITVLTAGLAQGPSRSYKVIEIEDVTGRVVAIKNREPRS